MARRRRRRSASIARASTIATMTRIKGSDNDHGLTCAADLIGWAVRAGRFSSRRRGLRGLLASTSPTIRRGSPFATVGGAGSGRPIVGLEREPDGLELEPPPVADGMFSQYWFCALTEELEQGPPSVTARAEPAPTRHRTSTAVGIFPGMAAVLRSRC